MAETDFAVEYDGPALATGRMPVRELAPALLALGDIFTDASRLLYPDREPVALNIEATREGSFLVRLVIEADRAWDQLIDIFTGDAAQALANLKELIIGGGGVGTVGLFLLRKWLRGRRITNKEPSSTKAGHIRLTVEDGETIEIPGDVLTLYENVGIRRKTRYVVEPLTREGVDTLAFRKETETETEVVISKDDVVAFEMPASADEPLLDDVREMVLEIVSVVFAPGNKWRFTDGQTIFWAQIQDEAFLQRVEEGVEAFRSGDMLRCRVRIVQTRRPEGLHTDHYIVEVLERLPRAEQLTLGG